MNEQLSELIAETATNGIILFLKENILNPISTFLDQFRAYKEADAPANRKCFPSRLGF
jgi:hypothetical protein